MSLMAEAVSPTAVVPLEVDESASMAVMSVVARQVELALTLVVMGDLLAVETLGVKVTSPLTMQTLVLSLHKKASQMAAAFPFPEDELQLALLPQPK